MWSPGTQRFLYILQTIFLTFWIWMFTRLASLFRTKKKLPPIKDKLLLYSATRLAELIRKRKITSVEVVQAYIDRVKAVNPILNCVVQERFTQALQEAKEVDLCLSVNEKAEEELKFKTPLLGVPVTIKESIAVQGMSNNAGRLTPRERKAEEDAPAVSALRASGAIPILVSNTPQLCQSWETYNKVTGRTNNPYDTRRTPGGSSGGEGALISSAASVIGLGSDIGGSGRLPAMFCGIFGHKPSSGYISTSKHMPYSDDPLWSSVFAFTPMCRYAEDLPLVYASCIQDKEKLLELRLDEPVFMSTVNFYYMFSDGGALSTNTDPAIKEAINKAVSYFKEHGASTEQIKISDMKHSAQLSSLLMLRMKETQHAFQKSEDDVTEWKSIPWEMIKWLFRCSENTFHALFYGLTKKIADCLSQNTVQDLQTTKERLLNDINVLLGTNSVLLYPVFPTPAHYHKQIYYRHQDTPFMAIFNLLDLPATACPMGINKTGLPVGIQIIAARGQDRLCLAVAKQLESVFGGWVSPSEDDLMEVKTGK